MISPIANIDQMEVRRRGLYPQAPELTRGGDLTPARKSWVIKHGVKTTAMPSWGVTRSDALIWDMVASLQKAPSLAPAQYELFAKSTHMDSPAMSAI